MKNPPFTYHRPSSLTDVVDLLEELDGEGRILAGGQSLLPMMAMRIAAPPHLIDIGAVPDLDHITVTDDHVVIGALVRHTQAERSEQLATHAPLVHGAMPLIGHRAIRNRGTVVGSIAHGDPAAEMPAVCVATNATMVAVSTRGRREIRAADFFTGYLETALEPDELLLEVRFHRWSPSATGAVVEQSRRHSDYAMVGLVCGYDLDPSDHTVVSAALVFFGVGAVPYRAIEAEDALIGRAPSPELFDTAADIVTETISCGADAHASANYRRHLAGVLTRRGLARCRDRHEVLT